MANAALAYINLADSGTLTASSEVSTMPIERLQDEHVGKRWRSSAEPANFTLDLGADTLLDTVAVLGLTAGASASIEVKVSTQSGGAASGDVLTGTYTMADEQFDPDYDALVVLLAAPAAARYVKVTITDGPASYVEAGRLFVGLREALDFNFAPGAGVTTIDRSRRTKTAGGQTLVYRDNKVRTVDINLEWVSADQRYGLLESIDRENGQSTDVLLILDTASDNLARDSIWGLIAEPTPAVYTAISDIFARQLRIEERV